MVKARPMSCTVLHFPVTTLPSVCDQQYRCVSRGDGSFDRPLRSQTKPVIQSIDTLRPCASAEILADSLLRDEKHSLVHRQSPHHGPLGAEASSMPQKNLQSLPAHSIPRIRSLRWF